MKPHGLGDMIELITTATGIKAVVNKVSQTTGKHCGCTERKEMLNNPDLTVNKIFFKVGQKV